MPSHYTSLLAEVLAREIVRQVTGRSISTRCKLEVARTGPISTPEPVSDVPGEFLSLAGIHAAHPGTDKGRAYKRKAHEPDVTDRYLAALNGGG
ncbi:MAG: hypothetical protein ACLQT6_16410 [Desulfomonilaceae bacterium]